MSSDHEERRPAFDGYFADPFVLRTGGGYVGYGTVPPEVPGGGARRDGREFRLLTSDDLTRWTDVGGALERLPAEAGADYWAPEVAEHDGRFYLYYSVGHGDAGHHLRVAVADQATGPFVDSGVDLTPDELFAIDPHPFRDADGTWYLFFARDELEGERVGTMLAVDRLEGMTALAGEARTILRPDADWQVYQRARSMYGQVYDWHTLEGPFVRRRDGRFYLFFSGGSWLNETYGVAWAEADHPLGPWERPAEPRRVLHSVEGRVIGPGHNSIVTGPDGQDRIVYHAWDRAQTMRRMFIERLRWTDGGPRVDGFTG
ncbi:glycoside hydrolase family 43 protein [Cellulomonas fimi]|uniref:Family 43 glycosylhydrolase n=1 Tax=Cellulomonas fimi TaxID=1708 RepID=A0A7Y0LX14_CELFI|nr:glycoside hydrolase family 43 protein [Cellulomonas fimi]NMR19446.1 family 43 glycosylhydrolase [Cellulomonas fimi]